jgi:hypothetical protein
MKNLFDYATKELSQDAFLRWLFENYNCEDKDVCLQAKKLIGSFLGIDNLEVEEISELKTYSQWRKVDILLRFKYGDKLFCIAIEDKTYTEEHEQLKNYNKSLEEYVNWLKKEYSNSNIVVKKVFYKTAKLSSDEIERVKGNGWEVFDIDKIYPLFSTNYNIENNILNDYIKHIQEIFSACHTIEKPNKNESSIDFIKWESYFNNLIVPHLNRNGYQVDVWKAGQYPYICLVIKKLGFLEKSPYLEIRSRDCLEDNFAARILLYGVEREAEKFSILKENIESYTSFICQNYKQQIGETPKGLKATTDEEFITLVEKFTKEFLIVMKDWSL